MVAFGSLFNGGGDDTLEMLFDVTGGSAAADVGARVLLSFVGDFDTGGSLDFFSDEVFFADAEFEMVQAVPIPAALPLFLTGLFGLGWMARWRRRVAA